MPVAPTARALVAFACFALPWCAAPSAAQGETPPAAQQPPPDQLEPKTQEAIENLARRLQQKRAERDAARARGDAAQAADLQEELRRIGYQLAGLTSRIDVQQFEDPQQQKFDLQTELEQLVRPLLQTLKDATAEPRQVADLKARIEDLDLRRRTAEDAQRAVERTRDLLPAGSVAREEVQRELDQRWRPTLDALRGELLVLRARLELKESQQESLIDSVSRSVQSFVQTSGMSLLLAAGVFVAVFVGLRWIARRVLRRRRTERAFYLRVLEVLSQALILLVAVAATLVVPYARNDWLLLAVGIVFLIGAGWVLVKMLPQFFEQIRIVLNIGAVREGERILVDGLPYRVDALRFYSRLTNPELEGGELRMPVRELIGMRSRRPAPDEPWFPCRSGDVVLLADGQFGTVRTQTPEVVVVEHYGTWRSYPTAEFLEQSPRNLSRGFAVRTVAGIDYGHQAKAVQDIPQRLREALERGLAPEVGPNELRRVVVELAAAGSSSLDLQLIAEFAGSAAPRYLKLERRMQALFVAACTENGWTIPFPQLTVHRPA